MRVYEENVTGQPSPGFMLMSVTLILFGIMEVVTSFRHSFFVIETAASAGRTVACASSGACCIAAGSLILAGRRGMARVAIVLLLLIVVGRLGVVVADLFLGEATTHGVDIVASTAVALVFAAILGVRQQSLPP
jgi:hypothetical protein